MALVISPGGTLYDGKPLRKIEGDGLPSTDHREIADSFHAVEVEGVGQLKVVCGQPHQGVDFKGDSNILAALDARVEDGVLRIRPEEGTVLDPRQAVEISLQAPTLDGIRLAGQVHGTVEQLKTEDLDVHVGVLSSLSVSGETQTLDLDVNGFSALSAGALIADRVHAHVSGGSQARLHARQKLNVNVSGQSQVRFEGNPSKVQKDVTGSGWLLNVATSEVTQGRGPTTIAVGQDGIRIDGSVWLGDQIIRG